MSSFLEELREVEQAKKATGDVAREQRRKRRDAEAKAEIKAMEEKERARAAEALLLLEENDEDEGSTSSSSNEPSSSSDEPSSNSSGDERANFLAQQEYRRKIIEANEEVERVRASLEADRRKIFGIQQDDGHEVRLQGDELGLPPLPPTPSSDAKESEEESEEEEIKPRAKSKAFKKKEKKKKIMKQLLKAVSGKDKSKSSSKLKRSHLPKLNYSSQIKLTDRNFTSWERQLLDTAHERRWPMYALDIEYWCTDDMCADMLTKALPYVLLKKHRAEIQGKQ